VSYQILLGKDKYFVSTDAGGERQQWFALVRTPPGGQDADPTAAAPTPKRDRLLAEFSDASPGDGNGDVWDGFARELVEATREAEIKRRDLYDGAPLLREPARWLAPWADGCVAIAGDAAHPMMPNLGQGGCQSCEDGFRLVEELAAVRQTGEVAGALARYSRVRGLGPADRFRQDDVDPDRRALLPQAHAGLDAVGPALPVHGQLLNLSVGAEAGQASRRISSFLRFPLLKSQYANSPWPPTAAAVAPSQTRPCAPPSG
jgi:hypothetical protein